MYELCSQGEEWYRQRKVLNHKMMRMNDVQQYVAEMGKVADDFVERLRRLQSLVNYETTARSRE
jgi:cytochrome P450